jgi:Xaa-Pro aminopeptidase
MKPPQADAARALAGALRDLGLADGVIGTDDAVIAALLAPHLPGLGHRPAENTLRRIRLVKTPAEMRLMRLAAQQNVDAAMAAARAAREAGSARALRTRFWTEAARRGNTGVFMVVNGEPSEVPDEPLRDGMAFLIDCVSHCRHYHGDLGRTVFIGEPRAPMRRACEGIATAWREIQQRLKPGLRFADIPAIGREAIRKQGLDLVVGFNPHSVGLFHTDHPQPSRALRGSVDGLVQPEEALVVEEGMVLSIDCPVLEAGIGGTAHLEDLVRITATGAEPIHSVPEGVIVV